MYGSRGRGGELREICTFTLKYTTFYDGLTPAVMRGSQFNISLGALVVHALKREIEVATAKVNSRSGQITASSWLVDSGGGMCMTPDAADAVPGSLRQLRNCSAKIGSGDLCPATHSAKLQLHGRCAVTGKVTPFPQLDLWIVPGLAFKICSVGCLEDAGVQFITADDTFKCRSYLLIKHSGVKIQVKKKKNIYIFERANTGTGSTAHPAITHGSLAVMRASAETNVVHPRKHYHIDLWFVFKGVQRPKSTIVAVNFATPGGVTSPRFTPIRSLISGEVIEDCSQHESPASVAQLHGLFRRMAAVPAYAALSPNISLERTCDAMSGNDEWGAAELAILDAGDQASCCMHPGCERLGCVAAFANAHRSGVNKTCTFYKAKSNMLLQHGRFGHVCERILYSASKRGRVRGLDLKSPKLVCNCKTCNQCKGKRIHFRKICKSEDQVKYEDKLETSTSDYIGPMRTKSHGGATGAYICTHLGAHSQSQKPKTRFCRVYLVSKKSQAPACLRDFQHLIKSKYEIHCRHWRVDNASELKFGGMEEFRREAGCFFTYSPPYTPIRNREAEQMNNLLCTMALCMMIHGRCPARFWGLALRYAGEVWNRLPPEKGVSPIEAISGVVPDVSMLRVFWCPCYPLKFKEEGRYKFELHCRGSVDRVCRFVGLSFDQPDCWLYYDPVRDTIGSNAHIRFDESEFDGSNLLWGSVTERIKTGEIKDLAQEIGLDYQDTPDEDGPDPQMFSPRAGDSSDSDSEPAGECATVPGSAPDQHGDQRPPVHAAPRRSLRQRRQYQEAYTPTHSVGVYPAPNQQRYVQMDPQQVREQARLAPQSEVDAASRACVAQPQAVSHVNAAIQKVQHDVALQDAAFAADYVSILCYLQTVVDNAADLVKLPDPLTVGKARKCADWSGWADPADGAIKKEMDSMRMQNVGTEVERSQVPKGTNIVRSKGVFTRKYDEAGKFYHKFRLVACGYSQVAGLDYFETHAGVISITVVRMILSTIAALNLKACQFDIGTAFLECELDEDIYMRLPDYLGGKIWKLNRAIYGLKQSGHLFVKLLNQFLRELGFRQSKTEPQLFTLITKFDGDDAKAGLKSDVDAKWDGWGYMILGAYIDDILCASNSQHLIGWVKAELENKFSKIKMQDLRWLLGMKITIARGLVSMDQYQYCINVIDRFRDYLMEFCSVNGVIKTSKIPAIAHTVLSKADCPKTPEEAKSLSHLPYAELVGCLLFLSNQTRVDIAVAVNDCARFMSCFGLAHWRAALKILQYLMINPRRPLIWRADSRNPMKIIFHVDASFASCPDTARSRYGLIGLLNGALVCAKTGILKNVRTSSMDAETGALAQCAMQAVIARRYLEDMGFPQSDPTPIGEDNNAALLFSQGPVASKRSRHIHVDHHYTREQQNEFNTITVYREPGVSNFADDMTKNNAFDVMDRHTTISMGSPSLLPR